MTRTPDGSLRPHVPPLDPETTVELLNRVKAGDDEARERLVARCMPPLRRWARGRLPTYARDMLDTEDLVQDSVIAALRRIEGFEARREGALQAYLRQAVANRIKDVIRYKRRRPLQTELPEDVAFKGESPLDQVIGLENTERYEAAMLRLKAADREAIVARVELRYSYQELAVALGKPSPDAARVAVARAVYRLAREISHAG
ncbi:MAG: sigma-70 family RNA polymerase sigma factor [Vicinamibacterales bacterium]